MILLVLVLETRQKLDYRGGKGIVQPLPWNHHLFANVSFGHGMAATALQILMAYNSIVNGECLCGPF